MSTWNNGVPEILSSAKELFAKVRSKYELNKLKKGNNTYLEQTQVQQIIFVPKEVLKIESDFRWFL